MKKYTKAIILSDSFKQSIDSKGIKDIGQSIIEPFVNCESYAIADGGEGTVDFYINELHYQKYEINSINAFLEPIQTYFAFQDDTAVIDSAQIVGFKVNNHLDIMKATTYGIGLLIKKIIDLGFKKIIVGLGGSITNDGGSGLLEALGAKFYQDDLLVELHKTPFKMVNKADLKVVLELLKDIDLNILCDVSNPLLGPSGATNVFSEQKGSTPEQRLFLESWMKSYKMSLSSLDLEGFGAAGGLGFAFYMIGGKLKKGIEVLLNSINFENNIDEDTLVITGEGKLDKTSLQGKVVGYISEVANKKKAGLAIICGINELENTSFNIYPLHQHLPLNYKETVKVDLIKVFKRIVKEYFIDYDFLEVENVNKDDERYRKLRIDVFVKEQQIDEAIEFDELEDEAEHYILKYQNQLVGCFRLRYLKDYLKLERFLVKKEYRNLDFALAMIAFVKRVMKEKNINECLIHAQLSAQKFYEKGGFVAFGEVFQEADIDHILMKLAI